MFSEILPKAEFQESTSEEGDNCPGRGRTRGIGTPFWDRVTRDNGTVIVSRSTCSLVKAEHNKILNPFKNSFLREGRELLAQVNL